MTSEHIGEPHIAPMGERALLVSFGDNISRRMSSRVLAAAEGLRVRRMPGVFDIVPAYNSLGVLYGWQELADDQLVAAIRDVLKESRLPSAPHRKHVIPVRYGGDQDMDLAEVAASCGISRADVVRLHTSKTYFVAFTGFLPGFPYMLSVPGEIVVPRRATPRVSVPAGSVGIAAQQTGIYPFSSPGGWQIVGQTPVEMWDMLAPDPALLSPGDHVRFVTTEEVRAQRAAMQKILPKRPVLEVIQQGALTTVQDRGRAGYAHMGVGPAGAFDGHAAAAANVLVGNAPDDAVLEFTLTGPTFRVLANTTISLTGADFNCRIDGAIVPSGTSWFVRAGSTIKLGAPRAGLRGYMAIAGGIGVPMALGSCSTSAYGDFGGYSGRPLRAGDIIGVCHERFEPVRFAGRSLPQSYFERGAAGSTVVCYIPFDGPQSAGSDARRAFEATDWAVSERSDRMGIRLRDTSQAEGAKGELASFPVVRGAIQLPPDGQPIVLGPDHQTTGGYPLLGVVPQCEWCLLAQVTPGSTIRFRPVDLEEARSRFSAAERRQAALLEALDGK